MNLPRELPSWKKHLQTVAFVEEVLSKQSTFGCLEKIAESVNASTFEDHKALTEMLDVVRKVVGQDGEGTEQQGAMLATIIKAGREFIRASCASPEDTSSALEVLRCVRSATFFPEPSKASVDSYIEAICAWGPLEESFTDFGKLGPNLTDRLAAGVNDTVLQRFLGHLSTIGARHEQKEPKSLHLGGFVKRMNTFRADAFQEKAKQCSAALTKSMVAIVPVAAGSGTSGQSWQDDIPKGSAGDFDKVR